MRVTLGGIFTLRPTSSVTMRPLPFCAATVPGTEHAINAIAIIVTQTRLRRARFNSRLQQKSLARIARLIAKLFLAKSIGFDWREYIPDSRRPLYPANSPVGCSNGSRGAPITVAGPWPIFTAFQMPVPVQLSLASLCRTFLGVNQSRL